jgi:hypothetical protein
LAAGLLNKTSMISYTDTLAVLKQAMDAAIGASATAGSAAYYAAQAGVTIAASGDVDAIVDLLNPARLLAQRVDRTAMSNALLVQAIRALQNHCARRGTLPVLDLDTYATAYNTIADYDCLFHPDFAEAFYNAMGRRLTATNVFSPPVADMGSYIEGSGFTAGDAVDDTLYAPIEPRCGVTTELDASAAITVTGENQDGDSATWLANTIGVAPVGTLILLTPSVAGDRLVEVTNIVITGITAGALLVESIPERDDYADGVVYGLAPSEDGTDVDISAGLAFCAGVAYTGDETVAFAGADADTWYVLIDAADGTYKRLQALPARYVLLATVVWSGAAITSVTDSREWLWAPTETFYLRRAATTGVWDAEDFRITNVGLPTAGDDAASKDYVESRVRIVIPCTLAAVAASLTAEPMLFEGTFEASVLPRGGSITGLALYLNDDVTAGTLDAEVAIGGAGTGLTAQLNSTTATKKVAATQAAALDTFAALDEISVEVTTSGAYAPDGTANLLALVEVTY